MLFFKTDIKEARDYLAQFQAPSTERKERNKLTEFYVWCNERGYKYHTILDIEARIFKEYFRHIDTLDIQITAKARYIIPLKKFIDHLIIPQIIEEEAKITRNYNLIFSRRFHKFKMGGKTRNNPVLNKEDVLECIQFFRDRNFRDYILFSLIAYTGMRTIGVINLQVKNIDFGDRILKTQEKRTKVSKGDNAYIIPQKFVIPLKSFIIERDLQLEDHVFDISSKNIRKQLKKWRPQAHPHQFRDTLNTLWFEMKLEKDLRMILLNQNPGMNVLHYVKKYQKDLHARRDLYDQYFPY